MQKKKKNYPDRREEGKVIPEKYDMIITASLKLAFTIFCILGLRKLRHKR